MAACRFEKRFDQEERKKHGATQRGVGFLESKGENTSSPDTTQRTSTVLPTQATFLGFAWVLMVSRLLACHLELRAWAGLFERGCLGNECATLSCRCCFATSGHGILTWNPTKLGGFSHHAYDHLRAVPNRWLFEVGFGSFGSPTKPDGAHHHFREVPNRWLWDPRVPWDPLSAPRVPKRASDARDRSEA